MRIKARKRLCPGWTPGASHGLNRAVRRVLGVSAVAAILLSACLAEPTWARTGIPLHEFTPERVEAVQQFSFANEQDKSLHRIVAMGFMRLRAAHKGVTSSGGSSPAYDNSFGTGVDANGLFTFGLNTGASKKRVYVNSLGGFSDANNGLTAATAKATFEAGLALCNGGDQLLVAKAGTYANSSGNVNLSGRGGPSKTYPTVVMSYDPADPTNEAKMGKMFGPDMPIITTPSASTGSGVVFAAASGNDGTTHNIFVQGVEIKYVANDGNVAVLNYVGRHDGIGFQNCRFNGTTLAWPNNGSSFGLSQGCHVSRCSAWGAWSTSGNSEWVYFEGMDGLYYADCSPGHGGWKMGVTRGTAAASGGPAALGHNYYLHATCINCRVERIFSFDSATDAHNLRGSASCSYLVSLDCPIAINQTGTSNSFTEAPTGSVTTVVDSLFMGGDDLDASNPRGYGVRFSNAAATGVSMDNVLFMDNPKYGGTNNYVVQADASNTGVPSATVTLNRVTAFGFADKLQVISGAQTIALTWTNAITDTIASGAGNIVWTPGTTFPNAKTRDQVLTAFLNAASVTPGASYTARKKQVADLALYRPDFDWSRYMVSIAFPAYNKTQSLALLSPPNLSAVTPASIY